MHMVLELQIVKRAWDFATGLVDSMKVNPHPNKHWGPVCTPLVPRDFGKKILTSRIKYSRIWL